MNGYELADLEMFLAVAQHKSFSKAALQRGVAASAVSYAVRRLEQRVGVRLFHRTTRSVALTEAGERFQSDLGPAFGQIKTALEGLNSYRDTPFGTVRLNIPNSVAPAVLDEVLGKVLSENPGLHLDIVATDRLTDIVQEGFDAGIRFGARLSQDMVAVRIKTNLRFAVVGTPEYLKGHPRPMTPKDLTAHNCIRYRFPSGAMLNWEFQRNAEKLHVEVQGSLTLDDQELMVKAALQNCGLAFVWDFRVLRYIESGALVRVLEDWCSVDDTLYLYYPSQRHLSAGLKAVIAALRA
ncbi:LysR family transcriptional regulator [Pseudomonas taiwanensis]|uniref:LysR family transcriptional regulator n=1 Tax=Pseudomonas taiwanensis TaxID=470150 RepID=A0ABR6V3L8_9PSED|nr:LysR family transcriptional regulator [Pseudomonas taiwanensis]MBC3475011.1 LysR family transcriptional regulator [Pseudomonas taiwanensis]